MMKKLMFLRVRTSRKRLYLNISNDTPARTAATTHIPKMTKAEPGSPVRTPSATWRFLIHRGVNTITVKGDETSEKTINRRRVRRPGRG